MPLFMDVNTRGDTHALRGVAHAHAARVRGGRDVHHRVHYLRYWVDEARGKVFCLVDAPDDNAPAAVHRRTYSLLAKDISNNQSGPAQNDPARFDPARFDTAEIYRLQAAE